MVPAEFMPGAVTMLTDTPSQHPHLMNELLTRHPFEVFVHTSSWLYLSNSSHSSFSSSGT